MKTDEVIARVLPQFFPQHWLDNPGIVFTDFPSRIRIGYVLREDGRYSYIIDEEFARLAISRQDLHAAAVTNLAQLSPASVSIGKVPGGAEGWISATGDNFAAARILLPDVQREFAKALGETFLVSLSHRDDCFCWSQAQSPERQQKHVREALERFLQEDYNLTQIFYGIQMKVFNYTLSKTAANQIPETNSSNQTPVSSTRRGSR